MAHLMVVDDEASIRDALRQLFEYEGHEVTLASDGMAALSLLEESRPDLIFLDVKMPGLDAPEYLNSSLPLLPSLPSLPFLPSLSSLP